jgi:carbamoyltransferase
MLHILKRHKYVLGINDGHLATAALLKDGKIVACVSEERFTGIKNQAGIPNKSIDYCLRSANITPADVDLVVFGGKLLPPTTQQTGMESKSYDIVYSLIKPPLILARHLSVYLPVFRNIEESLYPFVSKIIEPFVQDKRIKRLTQTYKFNRKKIIFLDHHLSHAYTVLYSSGFIQKNEPLLIFTCDGEGDGLSSTVNIFKNGKLKTTSKSSMTNSVGNLYRSITKYLGMKPLEHEYKVMGLAAYVSDPKAEEIYEALKRYFWIDKKSLQIKTGINSQLFKMGYLDKLLKNKRFDNISYAVQKITESILIEWVESTIRKTKIGNVLLSGGVFMNVKANQKISEIKGLKDIYIMPSCGDESNAIGAAYWGYKNLTRKNPLPLENLYLGPEYSEEEIKRELRKYKSNKFKISKPSNMAKVTAALIKKGNIVARFSGRMEWGARALGNRSILADPINLEVVQEINKAIKCRDFWMPFAPVIMRSYQNKYISNPKNIEAPYMIITFNTTDEGKKDLAAAMHQYDKTVRPQVIDKKTNPKYYLILEEFSKLTRRYGLLNTSFNLHGFPIVGSPKDALYTFSNSGLKYLEIGNYLVKKFQEIKI